ncbi:hypothetical protein HK097_006837 [Rhizophlyctis rosea]|uniref:Uncharacterized protein n=1 Tax=Rhizophlyctis rosea TaxID=64517 RepID=A0AAD5SCF1_9FUNG|nr:hypothetical protein HK097_006837 [Rhizophlyctis rosea]
MVYQAGRKRQHAGGGSGRRVKPFAGKANRPRVPYTAALPAVGYLTAARAAGPFGAPALARTANNSVAYDGTQDPRVDLFYKLLPNTDLATVHTLLEASWATSYLDTLKLIFHAGAVRKGKSDRKQFIVALRWLAHSHPQTLLANLKHVGKYACWKDLLLLLDRLKKTEQEYAEAEKERQELAEQLKEAGKDPKKLIDLRFGDVTKIVKYDNRKHREAVRNEKWTRRVAQMKGKSAEEIAELKEAHRKEVEVMLKEERLRISVSRKIKLEEVQKATRKKLDHDPVFKAVYDEVVNCFAEALKTDLEHLESKDKERLRSISLAGKWAPSNDGSDDKNLKITYRIAEKMFPEADHRIREENGELGPYEVYLSKVRDKYRHAYGRRSCLNSRYEITSNYQRYQRLARLRKVQQVPETFMSANEWGKLNYSRVPAICMKRNSKHFVAHDAERFGRFIGDVKKGKKKIASAALLPHEMVVSALHNNNDEINELQWTSYVQNLKSHGLLDAAIAVCDVSGSMTATLPDGKGEILDAAIGFSLLLAEIVAPPFGGNIITFSSEPQFHKVEGDTLRKKIWNVQQMSWNMTTDFQKVFDMILQRAQEHEVPADQMIKTIFVFSDMQFDQADPNGQRTDHQIIKKKFEDAGYTLPRLVYWNLNGSKTAPVTAGEKNVCLVSGFSGQLFRLFTEGKELQPDATPMDLMRKAIDGNFEELVVVD